MSGPLTAERHEALDRVVVRLMSEAPQIDPYPLYRELRAGAPVFFSDTARVWLLTSHAATRAVSTSRDFGLGVNAELVRRDPRFTSSRFLQFLPDTTIVLDPPEHTRLRSLVSRAFTSQSVDRLRGYVRSTVEDLLDDAERQGGFDVVADFAEQIPFRVICEMLGVPHSDHHLFARWNRELAPSVSPVMTDEALAQADSAVAELQQYFDAFIAARRKDPTDDLLSALILAEEGGDSLTPTECRHLSIQMVTAGNENMMNFIANAVLVLLDDPESYRGLHRGELSPGSVVDEVGRFDPPQHLAFPRMALRDTEIDGVAVPAGQVVIAAIAAANRDPEVFERPDELDFTRPNAAASVEFGRGVHHCLGAPLARLEATTALSSQAARHPDHVRTQGEVVRRGTSMLRGLQALRVTPSWNGTTTTPEESTP